MEFRKCIPQAIGIQLGKHWVSPEARSVALTKLKPLLNARPTGLAHTNPTPTPAPTPGGRMRRALL